jgi:hypothetical protein
MSELNKKKSSYILENKDPWGWPYRLISIGEKYLKKYLEKIFGKNI